MILFQTSLMNFFKRSTFVKLGVFESFCVPVFLRGVISGNKTGALLVFCVSVRKFPRLAFEARLVVEEELVMLRLGILC